MSVSAAPTALPDPSLPTPSWRRPLLRVALAALALAVAGGLIAALAALVAPAVVAPPPRSPFGIAFREAAPLTSGLGGWILAVQSQFARALQSGVLALAAGSAGAWPLIGLALVYGVFHAAGPGHGKAVIAGYIVADERALRRGLALSFAASAVQVLVVLAFVGLAALVFRATAATMNAADGVVERASFALIALVGALVTWRKSARLADLVLERGGGQAACGQAACGHVHLTDAVTLGRLSRWRDRAAVVLAAGIRPCFGAVSILVLALKQGVLLAGIAAVVAMAVGTALTTGALAALAVFAKGAALRLAGGRNVNGQRIVAFGELVAGAFVLALGSAMLIGLVVAGGS